MPANLKFKLEHGTREPLYKQLSDRVRENVLSGKLKPGEKLPPTRELAHQLGLSRFTVVEAYKMLISQGYLEAGRGAGSRVSSQLPHVALTAPSQIAEPNPVQNIDSERVSNYAKRLLAVGAATIGNPYISAELNYGAANLTLLPLRHWRQSMSKHSRLLESPVFGYSNDPQGYLPLREAIADYVARSRSVRASRDQVAVFSGFQHALECISRILLEPGDSATIENPGFIGACRTMEFQGAHVVPIPVDDNGMIVSALKALSKKPKLIYVTPSHQDPTGVPLSLPRRLELLDYAHKHNAFIIEDDYDSEYRYGNRPIPSLQSLDEFGSVIYISTFRKMLYPMVRLAFLVLPPQLVQIVNLAKQSVERDLPMLEQCVLSDFIEQGQLERHIQRTRLIYNKRRQTLVRSIAHNFGRRVLISRENSGTHLVVEFKINAAESDIERLAQESGVTLITTRNLYLQEPKKNEFLWPFSNFPEEKISRSVSNFAKLLKEFGGAWLLT